MSVYVRKGHHIGSDNQIHLYLDSANVEVKPRFQRKGRYKDFLSLCQRLLPPEYAGIFHENVLNEALRDYYRRLAVKDNRWHERNMHFLWEVFATRADAPSAQDRVTP
jgi:hypothetical protein